MRVRIKAGALVVVLLAAGCGGGTRDDADAGTGQLAGGEASTTTAASSTDESDDETGDETGETGGGDDETDAVDCDAETLEATDTGISAETIVVTIMADTGSQAIPGMANGSVEAVQAWAELVNEEGGLACRQVEVRTFDSKINPDEARNGYLDGCQNSFAMVGTFALAVVDTSGLVNCNDAAGEATGLPEVTAVTQNVLHFCNPTTFAIGGQGQPCPPVEGSREITVSTATGDYMQSVLGDDAHGIFLVANTSPSTVASVMPQIRYLQDAQGMAADAEAGAAGSDAQSHYTPFATTLNDQASNFVYNTSTFPSFLQFRREAATQGDDSLELALCQATCYDAAFAEVGGDLAVGTKVTITHLPFEEADANPEVATFVDRVQTRNTFSTSSWLAARLFQQAVEDVVAADGPNGLTRASLLAALDAVEDFDAGGMIGPVTPAARVPPSCLVVVDTLAGGGFARVFPDEPGTLHCGELETIELDPTTAFAG